MAVAKHRERHKRTKPAAAVEVDLTVNTQSGGVMVGLLFVNQTSTRVFLEKINACSDGRIENNVFQLRSAGRQIDYTGRLTKRGRLLPEDYIPLDPGKTFTTQVDLTTAYAFLPGAHNYSVHYFALHSFPDRDGFIAIESRIGRFYYEQVRASVRTQ